MPIARVRTTFSGAAGSPWLSTAYFEVTAPYTANLEVAAVGAFWGTVDAAIEGGVSWTTGSEVLILDETDGDPLAVVSVTPATGSGGGSTEGAPTLLQGLMRWRTGSFVDGREVRGRWFVPGLAESVLVDGLLEGATQTTWNTAATTYIATAGISPVVWQRP